MATATRVAGDEEDEGVEEGNESFYSSIAEMIKLSSGVRLSVCKEFLHK